MNAAEAPNLTRKETCRLTPQKAHENKTLSQTSIKPAAAGINQSS
jgi:hypothetical protein